LLVAIPRLSGSISGRQRYFKSVAFQHRDPLSNEYLNKLSKYIQPTHWKPALPLIFMGPAFPNPNIIPMAHPAN
jgi:hypothetical protein